MYENVLDEIINKNSEYLKNRIDEYKNNPFLNEIDRETSIFLELTLLADNHIQNAPKFERKYLSTNFRECVNSFLVKSLSIENYILLLEDINYIIVES